jgi:signal transduction histidine kinase
MASSPDGRWNGAPASLAFTLRPPFVRTPAFYLLCIVAAGLLAVGVYRLRVGQMRARFDLVLAERTRIARELHDTLAQGVAGVGLQIETVMKMLDKEPQTARAHLRRAHAMARSSLDEIRRSIWVLRAQTSHGEGGLETTLPSSLLALTRDETAVTGVRVVGSPRVLDAAVERNVLRIAHEAVTNALRHSGAANVTVRLEFAGDGVELSVRDDGRGFDVEAHMAASGKEHFGLLGITERARILGGVLRVESRAGEGTEVFCRIPYRARADAAESVGEA